MKYRIEITKSNFFTIQIIKLAYANAIDNMENTELNLDELCDLLDEDEKEDTNETDNNVASLQDKDKSAVIPTEMEEVKDDSKSTDSNQR